MKEIVYIFKGDQHGDDWPPEDSSGFLKWFEDKIREIPEKYKKSGTVIMEGPNNHSLIYYIKED